MTKKQSQDQEKPPPPPTPIRPTCPPHVPGTSGQWVGRCVRCGTKL